MNTQNETGESPVSFTGAQGQSGKTECVLIYDPATGTFTLEKLLSTFTLNLTSPDANLHQPLTLPAYKPGQSESDESENESSEGDIAKVDKENPFDYRHFINNKFEVPTASSRIHDKTRQLEGLHESLSDRDASGEDDVDIPPRLPPAPLRQTLPARPRVTPTAKPKPKSNPRASAASKKSNTNTSVPVPVRRRGATPTESIDLTPTSHPQTGDKRPRVEVSSSESDVDDESEESEEDEETEPFTGSGELIIEGEDERNNSSRSTTAGVGSSWTRQNRGGPVSLSVIAGDVDIATGDVESASDEEEETVHDAAMPSPHNAPISLSGHGGGHRTVVEDETSSDEDEDEEPRHHYHQQQQHVPTPNGVDEYEEEEEEEEGEYDLENMMEELLEEQEEHSESMDSKPISLGGVRDDEETSEEE